MADASLAFTWGRPDADNVDSVTGKVEIKDVETKHLPGPRTVRVYLPPGYEEDHARRYAVMYLHDGQNAFSGDTSFLPNKEWKADEAAQALIEAGLIEPLLIVAIDNGGERRGDEFLPTRDTLPDGVTMGGDADRYARMVIEEIKPLIDSEYRTRTDPDSTAMCGSSLGGIITLHIGLGHPQLFGKLAVVSPSLWWDHKVMIKRARALPHKQAQRIWIDAGTDENGHEHAARARELGRILEGKGWVPGEDLAVYIDGYAIHREDAWARRFPVILMFLFGRHDRGGAPRAG